MSTVWVLLVNLGRSIKMCRVQRGLSLEEAAKRAGISTSYMSLIEQNKRDPPMSTVEKISGALNIPVSILAFLGADAGELTGFPSELRDKIASTALLLINAREP